MKKIIENITSNREKWLDAKKNTIGSSEIATILGLNEYQTPLDLWFEKTGRAERKEDNDHTWLGRELEPVVAKLYERRSGNALIKPDYMAVMDGAEMFSATPDYLHKDNNTIVEIKTSSSRQMKLWEDGNVPDYAHCQLIWQLGICAIPVGVVACLPASTPDKFCYTEFDFDKDLFNLMCEKAENFMKLVKSDTPPPALINDLDRLQKEKLNKLTLGRKQKSLSEDERKKCEELFLNYQLHQNFLKKEKEDVKNREEILNQYKLDFLEILGEDNYIELDGCSIELKKIDRKEFLQPATSYLKYNFKFTGDKNNGKE